MLRGLILALAVLTMLAACRGDDDGGSATQTPFTAPSPDTVEVALQKLDEIEQMIRFPG